MLDRWKRWPLEGHVKAFLLASLVSLVAGAALGAAMAAHDAWVSLDEGGWNDAFRLAHTHLLLAGWLVLMIFGVGYHMLPHLLGAPLRSPAAARLHAWLAIPGAVLLAWGLWRTRAGDGVGWAAVEAGGGAQLLGALLFAANLGATARAARAGPAAPAGFVRAFLAAAVVCLVLGLGLGLAIAVLNAADPLELAGIYWRPVHAHLLLIGFLSFMIFGVGYHLLPRFAGTTVWSPRLARAHAAHAFAGLALMVFGFMGTRAEHGPAWSGWVLAAGGLLQYAGFWMFAVNVLVSLWIGGRWMQLPPVAYLPKYREPAGPVVTAFRRWGGWRVDGFVKVLLLASLGFLLLGGGWGLEMVLADALDPVLGGRRVFINVPAHAHALTAGWVSLMILAVGYQLLPRFSGTLVWSARLARWQTAIVLAGLAGLVAFLYLNRLQEGAWPGPVAVAGFVTLAGLTLFGVNLGASFWRSARPRA